MTKQEPEIGTPEWAYQEILKQAEHRQKLGTLEDVKSWDAQIAPSDVAEHYLRQMKN